MNNSKEQLIMLFIVILQVINILNQSFLKYMYFIKNFNVNTANIFNITDLYRIGTLYISKGVVIFPAYKLFLNGLVFLYNETMEYLMSNTIFTGLLSAVIELDIKTLNKNNKKVNFS